MDPIYLTVLEICGDYARLRSDAGGEAARRISCLAGDKIYGVSYKFTAKTDM